jgi:intraflagellar transport protein 20
MASSLAKSGLYFDELSKIRVLEPEVAHETNELKEECRDFVESNYSAHKMCHVVVQGSSFIVRLVENLAVSDWGPHNSWSVDRI